MTPEEELELIELEQELRRRKPKVTPEVQAERDRSRANAERAKADLVEEDGMWVSKSEQDRSFGNKVLGFAQGLTGGAIPTLTGLAAALPGSPVATPSGTAKDYLFWRDQVIQRDEQAQEETPGYFAAKGGGQVASAFLPLGVADDAAKAGMTTLQGVKAGAKAGAATGAIQGGVQGALSADNAEQRRFMSLADIAKDAAVPALFGLGLGGLGGAAAGYLGAKVMNKGPFSRRGMDVSDVDTVPTPMGARVKQVGQIVRGTGKGDFLGLRGLAGDALESLGSRMERGRTSHIFAEDVDPTNMTRPPVEADVSNYQMPKATYVEDAADILSRDGDVMRLTPDELTVYQAPKATYVEDASDISSGDIMNLTPDEITAYNTGSKLDVDPNSYPNRSPDAPDESIKNWTSEEIEKQAQYFDGGTAPQPKADDVKSKADTPRARARAKGEEEPKGDKTRKGGDTVVGYRGDRVKTDYLDFDETPEPTPPSVVEKTRPYDKTKVGFKPGKDFEPREISFKEKPLEEPKGDKTRPYGVTAKSPNLRMLKDLRNDVDSDLTPSKPPVKRETKTAPKPTLKAKSQEPKAEESSVPKTDPEKSGIRELKNLAEFRNEFRGQTKDMAPEDIVDAFPPEKRVAVAEAGKAFALGGEKFLKAFDGNEVEAARYALDNGLVQSVDDLVKALNMKGSGSRMDAKNIAKELGYPDLPTVAPGSSRARKKATSEKLKKKKGP